MDIHAYWRAVFDQQQEEIEKFFHENAFVEWHNTNEHFTVGEFIRANCEYPGKWDGKIERIEEINDLLVTVVHVFSPDKGLSFHATSFIQIEDGRIRSIDEYWGDDGSAPQWRLDKRIGIPIRQ